MKPIKVLSCSFDRNRQTAPSVGIGNSHTPRLWMSTVSNYTVSDLYTFVKRFDKDFSAGAAVNPKLLNRNGTPKVFYHGAKRTAAF